MDTRSVTTRSGAKVSITHTISPILGQHSWLVDYKHPRLKVFVHGEPIKPVRFYDRPAVDEYVDRLVFFS